MIKIPVKAINKKTYLKDRLFNIIFPLWMIIFSPPLLFLILFANLIIDGLVIYSALFFNQVVLQRKQLVVLIIKAWVFGFLADLAGVFILFILSVNFGFDGYYAFESPAAAFSFFMAVMSAGSLITYFNYRQCRELVGSKVALRVGLAMGIVTAPWIFFIPSSIMW